MFSKPQDGQIIAASGGRDRHYGGADRFARSNA
jgi:hypothetical protein